MKSRLFFCLAALLVSTGALRAEVSEVRIAQLYGLAYLPLMIMEDGRLLEKHAEAAGLGDTKVSWTRYPNAPATNEALLAGELHFAAGGVPSFTTLWAKTQGNADVKAVAAMNSMPLYLNTRDPKIKTLRDFTKQDRIALPAVKVSAQAIILQMAAEQSFGEGKHGQLDGITVAMSHPQGMAALLAESGGVSGHFTSPPYQYQELARPGVHTVVNSYGILGGPAVFTLAYSTERFRRENPRLFRAFIDALDEAMGVIAKDKRAAAEIYLKVSKDKDVVDNIVRMLNDPEIEFSTTPKNLLKQVSFLHRVGAIPRLPESWKSLFFPEAHGLGGS